MAGAVEVGTPTRDRTISTRLVFGEPLRRFVTVSILLLSFATIIVAVTVSRVPRLSPYDEATHADYAYQISHGHVPARGSVIAPEILHEWSCHGSYDEFTGKLPPCGQAGATAAEYPWSGQNYNFFHPPLYYAVTGIISRLAGALLPGGPHFITLARLLGSMWLAAAMLVLYLAVRRFRVDWKLSLAAAALLPTAPQILEASTTVTNDAAAALCGSLAVLMLARIVVQRNLGWVVPALVAGLSAATKVMNAIPMLSIAGALAITALVAHRNGRRTEVRSLVLIVLGILTATGIVYFGWNAFQAGRGVVNWTNPVSDVNQLPVTGSPFDELLSTSLTGLDLIGGSYFYLPRQLTATSFTLWVRAFSYVTAAAPLLLLALAAKREAVRTLAFAALLGMVAYPIIVETTAFIDAGTYFPSVGSRYGMSLIPLLLAALAVFAHRRGIRRLTLIGAGIGCVVTLCVAFGIGTTS